MRYIKIIFVTVAAFIFLCMCGIFLLITLMPSVSIAIDLNNQTESNLTLYFIDVSSQEVEIFVLPSKSVARERLYSGESTKIFKSKSYMIIAYTDKGEFWGYDKKTGSEIYDNNIINVCCLKMPWEGSKISGCPPISCP